MEAGGEKTTTDKWKTKDKNGRGRMMHPEFWRKCISIALKPYEGEIRVDDWKENKNKIITGFMWLAQRGKLHKS